MNEKGFTLLIAIVVTAMMLLVSFVVVNVAVKQLLVANANEESQYAFYNSDSGTECALYWDLKGNSGLSVFDPANPGSINCGGANISITPSGGGSSPAISTFTINYPKGCAIVTVTKQVSGDTSIDSKGYNNCGSGVLRKFERGVTLTYQGAPLAVGGGGSCVGSSGGTGGTISNIVSGGITYKVHTFTSSGTFVAPDASCSVEYLVVAGGGGGGGFRAGFQGPGSGGGGGALTGNLIVTASQSIAVTVGNGGVGGNAGGGNGGNGGDSSFGSVVAHGGGYGSGDRGNGGSGGSGGGGSEGIGGVGNSGGYNPPEGYNGGNYGSFVSGAGGGAGGAAVGGTAGPGIMFYGVGYAGGGTSAVVASLYGGGTVGNSGTCPDAGNSSCGADGRGGGGSGGYTGNPPSVYPGGSGGSGVVIIRYPIDDGTGGGGGTASWYSPSWLYRKVITIDHTKVPNTDQTNFPIIYDKTDADLISRAQTDADDILFTSSDGTTKLDHEIEKYISGSGKIKAWVKIPTLSHTTDTVIYMYYGNASAVSQQNISGTWNSNYRGVWHLPDSMTSTAYDSTSYANNLTWNGGISSITGQIDGGAGIDGANGSTISKISGLTGIPKNNNTQTIEAWFKLSSLVDGSGITIVDPPNSSSIQFGRRSGGITFWKYGGTVLLSSGHSDPSTNTWHHVAFTTDGTNHNYYYDGTLFSTGSVTLQGASPTKIYISTWNGTNDAWNGGFDEVRISNVARSADWIQTQYNNQSSPSTFYSVGSQETDSGGGNGGGGTITYRSSASGVSTFSTPTDVTEGGAVTSSGSSACSGTETPIKAFDNLMTSGNFSKWCEHNINVFPQSIMYDFSGTTAYPINSYTITTANDASGRDPKDWTFQGCQGTCSAGSDTGWTILDTRTNQFSGAARYQTNTYSFTNSTSYQQYRLKFTANNGDTSYMQMAEIQMFNDTNVITINKPSGTVQNDTMIASISVRPNTTIVTPPSGWTLIRRTDNANVNQNSIITYRKLAGSAEPSSYAWTFDSFTSSAGGIMSFSGVNVTTPVDIDGGQNTSTLNVDTPSVTTTVANTMVVTVHETSNSSTWTPPTGMTEAYEASSLTPTQTGGISIEGNYVTQASTGATGVKSATQGSGAVADAGNAQVIVLKP